MPAETPRGWTRAQRRLHWWTAALVLLGFVVAWIMVAIPLHELLAKFMLYQLHKSVGLTVFLLTVIRLAVRVRRGRPAPDAAIPRRQRLAASIVHGLFYGLLLVIPALGYLTAATAPALVPTLFLGVIPIPHLVGPNPAWFASLRTTHRALAILLVVLACGHALIAISHHRQRRTVLHAMWRG